MPMKWTNDNIIFLMNNWQEKSDEELAEMLETTAEAVKSKRKRLKLKRQEKVINSNFALK